MSDNRRSVRAKKTVTYSAFGDEDDSDDDFARSTPPPSKKTKLDKKEKSGKVEKTKSKAPVANRDKVTVAPMECSPKSAGRGDRKERVSVVDKMFDNEMKLALELSMQDSSQSQTNEPTTDEPKVGKKKAIEVQIHTGETTTPSDNKENRIVAKPAASFPEPDDEIILLDSLNEDEVAGGRRKRQAAKAAVARQREMVSEESDGEVQDQEFQADSSDESSSDAAEADSDYEEFTSSKKKTKAMVKGKGKSPRGSGTETKTKNLGGAKKTSGDKKAKPSPRTVKITNSVAKPCTPVTPLARRTQATGSVRGFTPPVVTTVKSQSLTNSHSKALHSPSVIRKPSWSASPSSSPDANPLGGVKLVSPGQPIRLGLSRNARIKPLHPNVKTN